jgi:hypothetical protein
MDGLIVLKVQVLQIAWIPCHRSMMHPPDMEGRQPTRGGPPAFELGAVLKTPHRKKISLL